MLPPNSMIAYDSTHASIPAGWTRATDFDDRFPKAVSSDWGNTGGSSTHTHTLTHNHPIEAHRHTVSIGGRNGGSTYSMGTSGNRVNQDHTHFGTGRTGWSNDEACTSTAMSLAAASSDPAYYTVIFLRANGYSFIPTNGIIWRTTTRALMTQHSASSSKFFKGAATAADAGSTGGANTHYHTQSHTHTLQNHTHATGYAGYEIGEGEDGGSGPSLCPSGGDDQMHSFSSGTGRQNMSSNSSNSESSSTIPSYKELIPYEATANTLPAVGDIVMTTASTLPTGWIECDGTNGTPDMVNYFLRNNSSYGGTGGSNTHSHEHTHTHSGVSGHVHSLNSPTGYHGTSGGRNGSGKTGVTDHTHNVSNCQSLTVDYDANTTTTSTSDNAEPAYIKVRFIQATDASLVGGAVLLSLL